MPLPNIITIATRDVVNYDKPEKIENGFSNYGLQMADYRGELYGIMTESYKYPTRLFATKYKEGAWTGFREIPQLYRAQGRVSVTVLEDRFFVAYRGTDDGVYLVYTQNFEEWTSAGRVGSKYAKSVVSPAIAAHDGKIHVAGVGADKYIYHTVCDKNGKREQSWRKVDGTGTRSALAMVVYGANLYLLHTSYTNKQFFYQTLGGDGVWSSLNRVSAPSISSGLSAVAFKWNQVVVTYRGINHDVKFNFFDGERWSEEEDVGQGINMQSQTGLATWDGKLVLSVAANDRSTFSSRAGRRHHRHAPQTVMNEKGAGAMVYQREVDEWDVKWKNQGSDSNNNNNKSMIRKLFCL